MNALVRLAAIVLALLASPLCADVQVTKAWVRGTVAGQSATGAFMALRSSEDCVLLEARSPVAGTVEIHAMSREGNVMKMRALPGLELPAGKTVELKPGGNHIMLMDLNKPLGKGETVPIILLVKSRDKKAQAVEIQAEVLPLAGGR